MKRLTLLVTLPDEYKTPLQEFVDGQDTIHRFMTWKATGGNEDGVHLLVQFWGESETYEAEFGSQQKVIEYELFSGPEESFFVYSFEETDDVNEFLVDALADSGVFFDLPTEYPVDEGAARLRLIGAHSSLQEVVEQIPDETKVTVEKLETYGLTSEQAQFGSSLTARQREAVRIAHDVGYYEVPRNAQLDDVADRLGCTKAAASQILRRAEATLTAATVD